MNRFLLLLIAFLVGQVVASAYYCEPRPDHSSEEEATTTKSTTRKSTTTTTAAPPTKCCNYPLAPNGVNKADITRGNISCPGEVAFTCSTNDETYINAGIAALLPGFKEYTPIIVDPSTVSSVITCDTATWNWRLVGSESEYESFTCGRQRTDGEWELQPFRG